MITTNYSKSINLLPIALVAFAITLLASCSSSTKVASSFSKRKYNTGHFADPVAKLKTDYKPGTTTTVATVSQPKKAEVEKTNLAKTTIAAVKATFNTPVKAVVSEITKHQTNSVAIAKTSTTTNSNNVSLKQNSDFQGNQANVGGGNSDDHHHHYLMDCLLCVLVCVILILLGSLLISPLILTLGWIASIAAIVFFILWLISIA